MKPGPFREIMRNLAAGVTVITTSTDGQTFGMTATSFTSVSLEPPLVQVSLELTSRTHAAVSKSKKFAANILGSGQEATAIKCAEADANDRWDDVEIEQGSTGVPLIAGAIGTLECEVTNEHPGGDHTVFIGRVVSGASGDGAPLVYFRGEYTTLGD